jgi:excinuclease UvrABC nuclease subunit
MQYGWTLEKASWIKLVAVTRHRVWRKVSFSKFEKAQVPTVAGVYVFCAGPPNPARDSGRRNLLNGLFNVIYVGQTVNLRSRFDNHLRKPMDPMQLARAIFPTTLEFWFTPANSEQELCELERILIKCFGPPVNRQEGPTIKGIVGKARPA